MNPQETAQAVLDQIRMHPETHYQGSWESICGTTRCVAGWAQFFHEGRVVTRTVRQAGARYLGLSQADASILFNSCDDAAAVHALEYLAKGDKIDWSAIGLSNIYVSASGRIIIELA